uniref:p8 n=1 Tax=Sweet potato chlorotic stunt virus TaxID=81931 RepID=M1GN34_9CLOS|nr:p8 [Sweet potato chlorotic stunt virus]
MDFSELIEQHGIGKISNLVSRLVEIRRTGRGLTNLLLDIINDSFVHFDSKRSPCGFEKEDYILVLQIITLLRG